MSNVATLSLLLVSNFGAEGTVVPNGDVVFAHTAFTDGSASFTSFSFNPEVSYFVIENLAVGAGVTLGLGAAPDFVIYNYGARPTVGYYVPLGDSFGIFPRLGLNYSVSKVSSSVPGVGAPLEWQSSVNTLTFEASAPILFHHGSFFIGFGPQFSKRLTGRHESREGIALLEGGPYNIALASRIGGWF